MNMLDITFGQALRSLQVMSPVANIQFRNVLIDSSNYKAWLREYVSVAEDIFEPLRGYLESDKHEIHDFDGKLVSKNSEIYKMALRTFNKILFNLLQKSVDDYNQGIIDEYHELKDTEKHAAKMIIKKLKDLYGTMKLKDGVKVLERYMEGCGKKDNFNYSLDISKMSTSKIFLAALYVNSLYGDVKLKILEVHGNKTDIDMDELKMNVNEKMREMEKSSSYVSKSMKNNNGIKCYYCKEKGHKLDECPKLKKKFPNAKFRIDGKETSKGLVAFTGVSGGFKKHQDKWFIDSGCTSHMTAAVNVFENLDTEYKGSVNGVGGKINVEGKGNVKLGDYTLYNTEYAPELPTNLLSVAKMTEVSGECVIFTSNHVYMTKLPSKILNDAELVGRKNEGLYEFIPDRKTAFWIVESDGELNTSNVTKDVMKPSHPSELWHSRFGHPGGVVYSKMMKTFELPKPPSQDFGVCPTCALSKNVQRKGKMSTTVYTTPLQMIQVDLCGGFRYREYIDAKYFLTIRDAYSGYYFAVPLKNKSDTAQTLINWIIRQENYFSTRGNYKVCTVRSDNGGEFNSQILHDFFTSKGIEHQLTVPYNSFQNGAVERAHRTIINKVRCLLISGGVPPFLWSEALLCAVYLINRTPHMGKNGSIPFTRWFGTNVKKLDVTNLRVFGCAAYAVLPPALRDGKMAPVSIAGVMVGYSEDHKGYRIYHPETNKVFVSNQVTFDETIFPLRDSKASHKAYDFAAKPLQGVPKYPDISAGSGSMKIPPIEPAFTPVTESIVSTSPENSEVESEIPSSPEQSDIEMVDYVPTDIDRLYEGQEKLLANQHKLAEVQQELSQPTALQMTDELRSFISDAISSQLQTSLAPISEQLEKMLEVSSPKTDKTFSPVVETPGSSPSVQNNHSTPQIIRGNIKNFETIKNRPCTPSYNNTVATNSPVIETPGSDGYFPSDSSPLPIQHDIEPGPEQKALPPIDDTIPDSNDSDDVILLEQWRPKRSHSDVDPASPTPMNKMTAESGALVPVTQNSNELTVKSPPQKKVHMDNDTAGFSTESGFMATIQEMEPFAVGDTLIPVFGISGAKVPYGDTTDHYCYLLTKQGTAIEENPLTSALVSQTQLDSRNPKSFHEATSGPDADLWTDACEKEICALLHTETFEFVDLPPERKAIPARWVLTVKDSGLYKARIVVQGFRQKEGIDYDETFAPVIRYESVRLFLAIAARHHLQVHQMDVTTAFLNSPIDKEIFVKPPPGYDLVPGKVWKLKKALYGLKQSPLLWNQHMKTTLEKIGFQQHPSEFGLFFKRSDNGLCMVALYVDDLLIASSRPDEIQEVKEYLSECYEMKDMGLVKKFLGLNIEQGDSYITLSLEDYIEKKIEELRLTDLHNPYTPLQSKIDYCDGSSPRLDNITKYQSLIGTLLFAANTGRPDVAYAVSFLSRFLKDPREIHYKAAKRIMGYLLATKDYKLKYTKDEHNYFRIYTDASYADTPDAKSTYGYQVFYAGAPISWCSKRISCVVLSTTEAEYVAANESVRETVWLNEILEIMDIPRDTHKLFVDNASALELLKFPVFHAKSKHIRVRFHFIRQHLDSSFLEAQHIRTDNQLADIMTKPLAGPRHEILLNQILWKDDQ